MHVAYKTVPSPSCPDGHSRSQVHSRGTKELKSGTTRLWRCRYEEDGYIYQHFFRTRETATESTRDILDRAVAMPTCGREEHDGWRIDTDEGALDTKEVVIALGPWSPDILEPLGIKLPQTLIQRADRLIE